MTATGAGQSWIHPSTFPPTNASDLIVGHCTEPRISVMAFDILGSKEVQETWKCPNLDRIKTSRMLCKPTRDNCEGCCLATMFRNKVGHLAVLFPQENQKVALRARCAILEWMGLLAKKHLHYNRTPIIHSAIKQSEAETTRAKTLAPNSGILFCLVENIATQLRVLMILSQSSQVIHGGSTLVSRISMEIHLTHKKVTSNKISWI